MGGAQILDISRTRHSLVIHVTPKNLPVYHQDIFFNPQRAVPMRASYSYLPFDGRDYVDHGAVNFAHTAEVRSKKFIQID